MDENSSVKGEVLRVAEWTEKEDAILTPDKMIRVNNKKQKFGSLMLINETMALGNGGFLNPKTKIGFIPGRVEDLQKLITMYNLEAGSDFSEAVGPHRIVIKELLEKDVPDNLGYRIKINPETQEILTKTGQAVWWKTEVVAAGSDSQDVLIAHDKVTTPLSKPAEAETTEAEKDFEQVQETDEKKATKK